METLSCQSNRSSEVIWIKQYDWFPLPIDANMKFGNNGLCSFRDENADG